MNVFIFGIDGASPDLVDKWIDRGHLPNLQKIRDRGCSGTLRSTFPPLTGPAWSTFQTGTNPGQHGVYHWLDDSRSYRGHVNSASSIRTITVWELISSRGGEVYLLSLPLTYPPRKVNGYTIPGFLTPDSAPDRSHPPGLAHQLKEEVPEFRFCPPQYFGSRPRRWVQEMKSAVAARGRAARYLFRRRFSENGSPPKHAVWTVHFLASDQVQHFLWDQSSENWDPKLDVFEEIDRQIGKMLEMAPPDSTFLAVSDHGFGGIDWIFNVNNWLREEGYLKLKRSFPTRLKLKASNLGLDQRTLEPLGEKVYLALKKLQITDEAPITAVQHPLLKTGFLSHKDVDWKETVAYSRADIGHIRLNVRGRENFGTVEEGDYQSLRQEIMGKLGEVRLPDSSKQMVKWIKPREELYSGPYLNLAPDVLFSGLERGVLGYGAAMFLSTRVFDSPIKPGDHRREGMLLAAGSTVKHESCSASMVDIAPTILNLLGYPIPREMDGSVIREISARQPIYSSPESFYREEIGKRWRR
ncbi:MAG: alkaline phosphatase family protein [Candidatus Bipolaricaulota bacterium]